MVSYARAKILIVVKTILCGELIYVSLFEYQNVHDYKIDMSQK